MPSEALDRETLNAVEGFVLHQTTNIDQAVRRCRGCGCTDDDCSQCIAATGIPCSWVDEDLCSACANPFAVDEATRKATS